MSGAGFDARLAGSCDGLHAEGDDFDGASRVGVAVGLRVQWWKRATASADQSTRSSKPWP